MKLRAVLTDLDGTLLDTSIELAASLNHALQSIDMRKIVGTAGSGRGPGAGFPRREAR